MPTRADILAEAARLRARFEAAGAMAVETPVLQSAGTLLDLYGEDIRGRAYTTSDALRGEQMLRPDFTVPVVQAHMANGQAQARYTYSGEVFRRQEDDPERASEFIQVGFEALGDADAAGADAEVFAAVSGAVSGRALRCATGDIRLLMDAVRGLAASDRRKAALLRHLWRPRRFRALLDRFAGRRPAPEARVALLAADDPFAGAGPLIGLRGRAEIAARIEALRADADEGPLAAAAVDGIDALLAVRDRSDAALRALRDLTARVPGITAAVDGLEARLEALDAAGIDAGALEFEASYGRTSMEYYDGFVFGFYAEGRPDLPPVATGGRYDALTGKLGGGAAIPAVGGVVRPGLMLELAEGGA